MSRRVLETSLVLGLAVMGMVGCDRTPAPGTESGALNSPTVAVDLSELEIDALQKRLQDGTLTSRRLTQWYLDRVAAIDDAGPMLNPVIAINPDALAIADTLDAERRAGRVRGPLHGISILIKDNVDTGDRQATTCSTRCRDGSTPTQRRCRCDGEPPSIRSGRSRPG